MKIKNIIKRITAFMLVGITLTGSVPVNAATNDSATTDVYVTQSSSYAIRIPKQLILEGKTGIGAYRVSVKGDISGTDIITIKPDESFYMSQEGKSDILTNIDQPKTEFTYADGVRPEVEVTADGKVTMEHISAGKWSGLFNFNITSSVDVITEDSELDVEYSEISTSQNNKTPISVTATGSNGENLNATSYVIEGQEKVDLLDKLAEANLINNSEEIDALIEVNSDNFEGIATTTFDVSSIANTGDEVIILHFDETKQEWEFIGQETVDENGLVTGDFTSYSPVAFVKVNTDGSYGRIVQAAGLYNNNGEIIYYWDELINKNYITVEENKITKCNDRQLNGKLVIDDSITTIGERVFNSNYIKLTEVIIPESINLIEEYAFCGISTLKTAEIYGNDLTIEHAAFWNCKNLQKLLLAEGITTISTSVFLDCGITEVTIPSTVTSIGSYAFKQCLSLKKAVILGSPTIGEEVFSHCEALENINLGNIKKIAKYMFRHCVKLKEISIPDTVIKIDESAFYDCEKLKTVNMSKNLKTIGRYAFDECALEFIEIPPQITTLPEYAFWCDSLKTVKLSKNIKTINHCALGGPFLETIYYEGTQEEWNKVNIADKEWSYFINANIIFNYTE